ncbi:MAG: YdcF family protein [Planctomycetota bacterium]
MRTSNRQAGLELLIRGGALFLGSTFLLGWLFFVFTGNGYDATIWWVDLRFGPGWLGIAMSIAFGVALLHRALQPVAGARIELARRWVLGGLVVVLVLNSLMVWQAAGSTLMLGVPVPLSAVLAVGVGFMLRHAPTLGVNTLIAKARRFSGVVFMAGCFALLGALAQMVWFGESDYRRPADAIVVYGCKAYADGTPSQALADRVHTACELYHEGLAPVIVMSGGPVRNADMHETRSMADYAVSLGVPREAIVLDPDGLDTQSTAENVRAVLAGVLPTDSPRLLAVSHDYHLPRVKLSLEREGLVAFTVPCEIRRSLPSKPYLMARETAAWWYYFFQPALSLE